MHTADEMLDDTLHPLLSSCLLSTMETKAKSRLGDPSPSSSSFEDEQVEESLEKEQLSKKGQEEDSSKETEEDEPSKKPITQKQVQPSPKSVQSSSKFKTENGSGSKCESNWIHLGLSLPFSSTSDFTINSSVSIKVVAPSKALAKRLPT